MDKAVVFVITPFNENFLALYEQLKTTFQENFDFINAGDLDNQQNILKDIVVGIDKSDVIIADLTGLNPNVFYELGLAHAMNKKVIIITQDLAELPFDIKSYRVNEYSMQFHKMPIFIEKMKELLNGAISGQIEFGNPVYDYSERFKQLVETSLPTVGMYKLEDIPDSQTGEAVEELEEPCIFDNIVVVEESMQEINVIAVNIGDDMKEMSLKIGDATQEIRRVKKTGGNSVNAHARNNARKVATYINEFSSKFDANRQLMEQKWEDIENNLLKYLDGAPINAESTSSMLGFIDTLEVLYGALDSNTKAMATFLTAMETTKGYERRLNAAITQLEASTNNYLNLVDKMKSSIDRIQSKIESITDKLGEDGD